MINTFRIIILLPELDRANIRGDEDGTSKKRVERSREEGGHDSLHDEHTGVWYTERLSECVES